MELWDKLAKSLQAVKDAEAVAEEIKKEIVERYCPYEVGEDITCSGYIHHGKPMRVKTRILHTRTNGGYYWIISGPILKKCGQESENTGHMEIRVDQ